MQLPVELSSAMDSVPQGTEFTCIQKKAEQLNGGKLH